MWALMKQAGAALPALLLLPLYLRLPLLIFIPLFPALTIPRL
jgi:hypothetical protein